MLEYGATALTSAPYYLVQDHLGSTRLVTDSSGVCQARMDYLPFGALVPRSGNCYGSDAGVSQKFTGQERDAETATGTTVAGRDFFESRYYASSQARFVSPDAPLADQSMGDPLSWNLFSYGSNNPLTFVDPDGQCSQVPSDGNSGSSYIDADTGGKFIFAGACSADQIGTPIAGKNSVTSSLDWDEARLYMLSTIGEKFSDPHQLGDFASKGVNASSGLAYMMACAANRYLGIGEKCESQDILYAAVLPGGGKLGRVVRRGSSYYRAIFFKANPHLAGADLVIHHAVEQQVLDRYPGVLTEAEMHDSSNLIGVPADINGDIHLSMVRKEWDEFYATHPTVTPAELRAKAADIDNRYGNMFTPRR
jgi:RHS repeat-associated protein